MAKQLFTNNNKTTNAVAILAADLTITLATGDGALYASPTGGDYQLVTLRDSTNIEIVKCTSRTGDVLTVTRAQESTTAHDFAAGSVAYGGATAGGMDRLLQVDVDGDPSGALAMTIQSGRDLSPNVASGDYSIAFGYNSKASALAAIAIGKTAEASLNECIAIGSETHATANTSIAIGYGAESIGNYSVSLGRYAKCPDQYGVAIGMGADSLSYFSVAIGASSYVALACDHAIAVGRNSNIASPNAIAFGYKAEIIAGADYAIAIGTGAINDVAETSMILGAPIISRTGGTVYGSSIHMHSGSKAILATEVVDLAVIGDNKVTLAIPTGAKFFIDKMSVVVTEQTAITGNPNISFGVTADTVKFLASTAMTKIAVGSRENYTPLDIDGQTELTVSVKAAAVGTSMSARFYFEGVMIQDEA